MLVSWIEGSEWVGLSQWMRRLFDAGKSKKAALALAGILGLRSQVFDCYIGYYFVVYCFLLGMDYKQLQTFTTH